MHAKVTLDGEDTLMVSALSDDDVDRVHLSQLRWQDAHDYLLQDSTRFAS